MRHHNTVFHAVLKLAPWSVFNRLVDEWKANKKVRRLTTQNQFIAMLYAQLSSAASLRAVEAGFESHATRLYHIGACEVSRSTLADANAKRPCAVFVGFLAELMARCERSLGRKIADAVYLIDSTGFRLSGLSADWAQFSPGVCGAKLHIVYNPDSARPSYAAVTPANVNDITAAKAMPIRAGATYVFDLAYYDYAWWAELNIAGCRLVTRLKVNTPLSVVAESPVAAGSSILSDRIGHLPARQARSRKNPFQDPVRELRARRPDLVAADDVRVPAKLGSRRQRAEIAPRPRLREALAEDELAARDRRQEPVDELAGAEALDRGADRLVGKEV